MIHNQFFKDESGNLVCGYGCGVDGLHWINEEKERGATPLSIVEKEWTQHPEIKWFPSTPVGDRESLPYVFDLFWDIKTPNQLKVKLDRSCDCKRKEIEETMKEHGIVL